jgi:ribosomal protein S18 acetylase RimI-like enzyme
MSFHVRKAEPRDMGRLVRLLETLFTIETDFNFDESRQRAGLKLLLDSDEDCLLVAEHGGEVIGMCSVQTVISTAEGGRSGWVEDLVIAEAFRGRGVGRKLLERVEAWAIANGVTRLQLLADRNNDAALNFYQRLGWTSTSLVPLRKFPRPDE